MARSTRVPRSVTSGNRADPAGGGVAGSGVVVVVGNTHVRWQADGAGGRLLTREALEQAWEPPPGPLCLVSVVPAVGEALLARWQAGGRSCHVLGAASPHGLTLAYEPPASLGADRLANAAALWAHHGPGIAIDAGTATTLTLVDADGVLRGGAILPGLTTARDALWRRTAQLPEVEVALPPTAVGASTVASIQAGVVLGHVGALRHLVDLMRAEAPAARALAVTGGWGGLLAPALPGASHEPDLTLTGARLVLARAGLSAGS